MRVLILYTEMAGYARSCIHEFLQTHQNNAILLFRYPVNAEAPFVFKETPGLQEHDYSLCKTELLSMAKTFQPDVVLCSGWSNADYLDVVSHYAGIIPTVLCFDNQWQGTLKQHLAGIYSRVFLLKKFSHVWVPGTGQAEFAKRLGFKSAQIHSGFYAADVPLFNTIFEHNKVQKQHRFPRIFITVARYIPAKGLPLLWQAFSELYDSNQTAGWQLWCFGQGQDYDTRMQHPAITHFGFVQPEDMPPYLAQTGVFVLPSVYEPWGVAVHEMAAAGFPMLLSDKVGAATAFLEHERNGFTFNSGNKEALKQGLMKMIAMHDNALFDMGTYSHNLAQKITPATWAETLQTINHKKIQLTS